uniref:Vitelline membrane outer layer 1 homolog n=1 Tax=Falco tinnunculus TaxID=100819 RepID=A0A8C4U4F0_FALTI
MPGGQVLPLPAGLAGAAGQGQAWDQGGRDASVITVSNRGPWGDWTWPDMCPKGSYASGISFKVQPLWQCPRPVQGPRSCGEWGHWSEACWCPHRGRLVGFALRVQAPQRGLLSDEVAATSARFACSNGHILEGPGSTWGQWGSWSPQCPSAVCSIQTRQEPARGLKGADTALNDLRLFCCL